MESQALLRNIPKIDDILRRFEKEVPDVSSALITDLTRRYVDELRCNILKGDITTMPSMEAIISELRILLKKESLLNLREVINATGVILHTNLGRACLSNEAADAACIAAKRYSTLEYDLASGSRGSRHSHVEALLCRLTGAESAIVVNNNAAAVLLTLSAIGSGGEVVISRGELVEIGGSFRMPDIMEQCGCRLCEVGTTNKTHLRDFSAAIGPDTKALLKVHTSNFRIVGFTKSVPLHELSSLAHENDIPVIQDLGSGSFIDLRPFGIHDEPTVKDSVEAGADIISFSGDKLLGGPQAGVIVGKTRYIEKLRSHPLARAVRVDKMTLAALEATLRSYLDPRSALLTIPTLRMLTASPYELKNRAEKLCVMLRQKNVSADIIKDNTHVGGGSVPCQLLPAYVVSVLPASCSVNALEQALRGLERPIIGRITGDRYLLDVRTLWDEDFSYIAEMMGEYAR